MHSFPCHIAQPLSYIECIEEVHSAMAECKHYPQIRLCVNIITCSPTSIARSLMDNSCTDTESIWKISKVGKMAVMWGKPLCVLPHIITSVNIPTASCGYTVCTYTCIHIQYVRTYAHVCMYVCVHVRIHTYIHAFLLKYAYGISVRVTLHTHPILFPSLLIWSITHTSTQHYCNVPVQRETAVH